MYRVVPQMKRGNIIALSQKIPQVYH